jgi:hypothetical protein
MVAFLWVGGTTGLLVAFLGIVAAVTGHTSQRRNAARQHELLASLDEELETLKRENAQLRSEQQRPMSLGQAAGALRRQVLAAGDSNDEGDETWSTMTDATVLQATIISACQDLQTAIHHIQTQLSTGIAVSELDRRSGDRPARRSLEAPRLLHSPDVAVIATGTTARLPRVNGLDATAPLRRLVNGHDVVNGLDEAAN